MAILVENFNRIANGCANDVGNGHTEENEVCCRDQVFPTNCVDQEQVEDQGEEEKVMVKQEQVDVKKEQDKVTQDEAGVLERRVAQPGRPIEDSSFPKACQEVEEKSEDQRNSVKSKTPDTRGEGERQMQD